MSSEMGTQPANRWNEPEETVFKEAVPILSRTADGDELIALPWIGLQYRNETRQTQTDIVSPL
ncbi:hypothetical protein AB0N24_20595 [Arthrobacter sp. NPDC093128]|uniref:hypothetical protein n=1 Tax=Arthrobacter sp. NPDC093128 TaxID=3154979 RepID=UPI00343D6A01